MNPIFRIWHRLLLIMMPCVGILLGVSSLYGHATSDAWLEIEVRENAVAGSISVSVHDMDLVLGFDGDSNGSISWGEITDGRDSLESYFRTHLTFGTSKGELPLEFTELLLDEREGEAQLVWRFQAENPARIDALTIDYTALFAVNRNHRAYARIQWGEEFQEAIFRTGGSAQRFTRGEE